MKPYGTLICAQVVSKLDYCNSVLVGMTRTLHHQLQSIFNAAARLVFSARRSEHVTPLFCNLHWLKVPEQMQFCLCVLTNRYGVDSIPDQHRHYSCRPHEEPHLAIEHFQWPLRGSGMLMLCQRLSEHLNRTLHSATAKNAAVQGIFQR